MRHCPTEQGHDDRRVQPGVVLLLTLVILVILATLGYTLSARVAVRRHRDQYIIDYSSARYACASALKCAMTLVQGLDVQLISRPNEPDFSDVFALTELQYQELLAQVSGNLAISDSNDAGGQTDRAAGRSRDANEDLDAWDEPDANDVNDFGSSASEAPVIPGPYGPVWPLVSEPLECEIGLAHVTVEIEDENAKYPLSWALMDDEKLKAAANVGFVAFCEWMGYTPAEIDGMQKELAQVAQIRPYKLEFKPMPLTTARPPTLRTRVGQGRTVAPPSRPAPATTISPADQMEQQAGDVARLFHSPLIDADLLSRPSVVSDSRNESAMKYLGLWATRHVNVNSAPRHVLEAALAFGSVADAPKIADEIIRIRREKPFADVDELKKTIIRYSDAIDRCKDFLTTTSTVFTVKVTAVSGVARATAIAAVSKEGDKIKQIGVVSD